MLLEVVVNQSGAPTKDTKCSDETNHPFPCILCNSSINKQATALYQATKNGEAEIPAGCVRSSQGCGYGRLDRIREATEATEEHGYSRLE